MGWNYVLPLESRQAGEASIAGAKAAGLNLLLRRGFPVPEGFVILPEAPGTNKIIKLRGLPPDFHRAVSHAYRRLGGLVAIRPISAGRDGAVLGVIGGEAVARTAARCLQNRVEQASPLSPQYGPIVVQRLVDAIASGSAYSCNPETGDCNEILIAGGWGIGCSKRDTPRDLFRLRKYPLLVAYREPAVKLKELRAGPVGVVSRPLAQELRHLPCLSDEQALRLAALIRRLEEKLGYDVQVEWALTARGFFLLQLDPLPAPAADHFYLAPELAGGYQETVCGLEASEVPTSVVSPWAWDFFTRAAERLLQLILSRARLGQVAMVPPLTLVAGRVYLNRSNLAVAVEQYLGLARGSLARDIVRAGLPARLISRLRLWMHLSLSLPALAGYIRRLDSQRLSHLIEQTEAENERLDRILAERLDPPQLAAALESADAFLLDSLDLFLIAELASWRFCRLQKKLRRWCGPGGDEMWARLLVGSGAPECAGPAYALWHLARALGRSAGTVVTRDNLSTLPHTQAGRETAATVETFVADYGHYCTDLFDLAKPRWGDDPALILDELAVYADLPAENDPDKFLLELASQRSLAASWIEGRLRSGLRPIFFWRRRAFKRLNARLSHEYLRIASARSLQVKLLWRYRRFLLRAGQTLCEGGWLKDPKQVFFLKKKEICSALRGEGDRDSIGTRITQRTEAFHRYRTLAPPSVVSGLYTHTEYAAPALSSAPPKGIGVSPGKARGRARVINSADDRRAFMPGEIIVARNLDIGWAPLLIRARGIATEFGGWMSAQAVLAREYGLPAVVRAANITSLLKNGDLVEIDGATGRITRLQTGEA